MTKNKNYQKGLRKEYKTVHNLKKEGYEIAQRSAGSHSPIDVFAINKKEKKIVFVQCKPDNFSKTKGKKILEDLEYLKGKFEVEFWLR